MTLRSAAGAVAVLAVVVGAWTLDRGPAAPPPPPRPAPVVERAAPPPPPPAPSVVDVARSRAAKLAKQGNLEGAIALLETTRVNHRDDVPLSCDLAHLYNGRAVALVATDVDRAEKVARTAWMLCPKDDALAKNLARILARRATDLDDEPRKRDLLEQSLALEEQSGVLVGLAEISFRQNDPKAAVGYYERAVALEPENPRLGQRLAEVRKQAVVEGSFADVRHDHFVARFEGTAQERLAWQALEVLEQAYFKIGDALSLHPRERLTVVIYTGAQYAAAIDVPDWSAGAFDGKIRVRQGDIAAERGDLVDLLFHEYVHALLATTVQGRVPAWFHEGLAQRLEPGAAATPSVELARAKEDGTLPSMEDLTGSFTSIKDPARARIAYATARGLVDAMADARGSYSLAQLLATMNQGRTFEEAFASTYATDLGTFAARWRQRL